MKVIDKREKDEQWQWSSGDVICCWDEGCLKSYGIITFHRENNRYYFIVLNAPDVWLECEAINITLLKTALESSWEHVEKVNAHLVVED